MSKQIVFVSDYFSDQLTGGAELSLGALMDSASEFGAEILRLNSKDVTADLINLHKNSYWVFGNYAGVLPELLQKISGAIRYSVIEFDYKYCKHRLPQAHTDSVCDCENGFLGKFISGFMYGAETLWFMSQGQLEHYARKFPSLVDRPMRVLGSTFSKQDLEKIVQLAHTPKKDHYLVLQSDSWVKGTDKSVEYCKENNLPYKLVGGVSYDEMLSELAQAKGLVYMPQGYDTCPRLVIEAKILGAEIRTNSFVQHISEPWFYNLESIFEWLLKSPAMFWADTLRRAEKKYTISSYFTTRNCVQQEYPFEQSIESCFAFSDEIVVVDGGSTDGTLDRLEALRKRFEAQAGKVFIVHSNDVYTGRQVDASMALADGQQKALARSLCTSDFCWQMDVDEIVHEDDAPKILELAKNFPKAPMIALPVTEYWGGFSKIRMDITPWKWRMGYNSPRITHGVPADLRTATGATGGTDGCDPIDAQTGDRIPHITFWDQNAAHAREHALLANPEAVHDYSDWFARVTAELPGVHHLSWLDINRKIRLYRDYWSKHWDALFGSDEPSNHFFPGKKWTDVTNQDIEELAKKLTSQTGGHIFHAPWAGQRTPWIDANAYNFKQPPACLNVQREATHETQKDVENDW